MHGVEISWISDYVQGLLSSPGILHHAVVWSQDVTLQGEKDGMSLEHNFVWIV